MTRALTEPRTVGETGAELGESPRWDAESGTLQWVDIRGGFVHRTAPGGATETIAMTPPTTFALSVGGRTVLAGLGRAIAVVDLDDPGSARTVATIPGAEGAEAMRLNDAACDARGRIWAGTMDDELIPGAGALYRLDRDGLAPVVTGTTISNGIDWSPGRTRMYFVDTPALRIDVFDYDDATGAATDRRMLVDVTASGGRPDGICVDSDGGVWLALVRIGEVHRYDERGTLTHVLALPVSRPTACAFGGEDLATLYVTTAWETLDARQRASEPLAGRLFAADPGGARGIPERPYRPDSAIVSAASASGS